MLQRADAALSKDHGEPLAIGWLDFTGGSPAGLLKFFLSSVFVDFLRMFGLQLCLGAAMPIRRAKSALKNL